MVSVAQLLLIYGLCFCFAGVTGEQGRRIGELVLYNAEPNVAAASTECDAESHGEG